MMVNEASHGGMAEAMGLGHRHMTDVGGYHCASHAGEHGAHHVAHMHNETRAAHDGCPGGSAMHDMRNPMMPGGMMGG